MGLKQNIAIRPFWFYGSLKSCQNFVFFSQRNFCSSVISRPHANPHIPGALLSWSLNQGWVWPVTALRAGHQKLSLQADNALLFFSSSRGVSSRWSQYSYPGGKSRSAMFCLLGTSHGSKMKNILAFSA